MIVSQSRILERERSVTAVKHAVVVVSVGTSRQRCSTAWTGEREDRPHLSAADRDAASSGARDLDGRAPKAAAAVPGPDGCPGVGMAERSPSLGGSFGQTRRSIGDFLRSERSAVAIHYVVVSALIAMTLILASHAVNIAIQSGALQSIDWLYDVLSR